MRAPILRAVATGAVALTALALAGCSGGGGGNGSGGGDSTIRIAYSVDQLDAGQSAVLEVFQNRIAEFNSSHDEQIEFDVYNASASVEQQITDVENALIKEPDVLIISVVDSVGSEPAIEAAHNAGVKVINTRPASLTDLDPNVDVAFAGTDETAYAQATVDWMQGWLDDNPDDTLRVGLMYGAAAQTPQLIREKALEDFANENPDRVQIVAQSYTDWLTDSAQSLAQDWLVAYPDINYISCANDAMALGVGNALRETGQTDDIAVSGYDLLPDAILRVQDGTQTLTVGVPTKAYGEVIDIAVGLVDGSFTDRTYISEEVASVTADNVDQFIEDNPDQVEQ